MDKMDYYGQGHDKTSRTSQTGLFFSEKFDAMLTLEY